MTNLSLFNNCCMLLMCFLITMEGYAQTSLSPVSSDEALRTEYLQLIKRNLRNSKVGKKEPFRRELNVMHKQRFADAKYRLDHDLVFTHPAFHLYLREVKDRIAQANPQHNFNDLFVLLGRNPTANAFSTGDGTIVVNLGLIYHLTDEAELAFTLCHEFAHTFLNHSDKRLVKRYEAAKSESATIELNKVYNNSYEIVSRLKMLIKTNVYSRNSFSRQTEQEADSLALVLYLNAGYPKEGAQRLLNILADLHQTEADSSNLDIFSVFNLERVLYNFDRLNIAVDEDDDLLEDDSMNTHPDGQARLTMLQNQFYDAPVVEYDTGYFGDFSYKASIQLYHTFLDFGYYGKVINFHVENKLPNLPEDFRNSAVIISLYKLVEARKDHRSNEFIARPSEDENNVSNDFSHLIYGTRLNTLSSAFYEYAAKLYENASHNESTLHALINLADYAGKKEAKRELSDTFINEYPSSLITRKLLIEKRSNR